MLSSRQTQLSSQLTPKRQLPIPYAPWHLIDYERQVKEALPYKYSLSQVFIGNMPGFYLFTLFEDSSLSLLAKVSARLILELI